MGCEENADRSDPEAASPCVGHVTRRAVYGRLPGPSVGPDVQSGVDGVEGVLLQGESPS